MSHHTYRSKADHILDYLKAMKEAVTVREIQRACGISSTSVVVYNLNKLREAGLVDWEEGRSRTISLTEEPYLCKIELPWVPAATVRGNSRAHFIALWRAKSELTDRGIEYGLAAKSEYPDNDYPLAGDLELEIEIWNPKRIDWDNLAVGYKAFTDGLQEVVKRDKYGDVLGAGLIRDDAQIRKAIIQMHVGTPRTKITLRQLQM